MTVQSRNAGEIEVAGSLATFAKSERFHVPEWRSHFPSMGVIST
jgi:hypothetical protein